MEDKSFLHGLDASHRLDEVAHEGHAARIIFPDNLRVQTLDGKWLMSVHVCCWSNSHSMRPFIKQVSCA